jgi:hypothetical protein
MTDASPANGPVTVVLVHGAFADGSSWSGVIPRLQAAGIAVRAVVNPLCGIGADSPYVASVFSQIPGPAAVRVTAGAEGPIGDARPALPTRQRRWQRGCCAGARTGDDDGRAGQGTGGGAGGTPARPR